MKEDEFYIGYQEKAPTAQGKFVKRVVIGILIGVLGIGVLLAINQKGFSNGTFELGQFTELEGVLTFDPVPMIRLNNEEVGILLIGYGKFGAEGALRNALGDAYVEGYEYKVKLTGTLIYSDGKALMELTKKEASVLSFEAIGIAPDIVEPLGKLGLKGEIVDPKCYFGVMKPGEGKPHRSCAIRCISGGIPPVFKVKNSDGSRNYFILRGGNGQPINELVLDYVAEAVSVQGEAYKFQDWVVLELNETFGIQPLH